LALLTPLTIGRFVLVAVIVALAVLLRRSGGFDAGVTGLLSGAGLLMVYIAYLNRDGPGEVCRINPTGQECTSEWSPWPWLVLGIVLVAAGVLLFRRFGGRRGDQRVHASGSAPSMTETRR
jgi:di/tricarboxylate transporter